MQYITTYHSPLGEILLAGDEQGLTGLWFSGAKFYAKGLCSEHKVGNLAVFDEAKRWLDIYFAGKEPDFMPALHLTGSSFQLAVWNILRSIPYGKVTTYGEIAGILAARLGLKQMSAQAVGGAIGYNKLSIVVPCHRVVGKSGSLTGYAGGIDRKVKLLAYEGVDVSMFFEPKHSTAS